jgi:hypothetical protein
MAGSKDSLLIVDPRTPDSEVREIEALGFKVVAAECLDFLYEGVKGHPDLQFAPVGDRLICHRGISLEKLKEFQGHGIECIPSYAALALPYPGHVILNASIGGGALIHRTDITDGALLEEAIRQGLRLIDVRQGYGRCSTSYIGNGCFATNDSGVAAALSENGFRVFISPYGDVELEGFDYGFLGGCLSSVVTGSDRLVLVSGNLNEYVMGRELREFIISSGAIPIEVGKGRLKDRGSVLQVFKKRN